MLAIVLLTMLFGSACAKKIEPWERQYLALPQMSYDAYPLDKSFRDHVYFSREATHAEESAAGGGCGCN